MPAGLNGRIFSPSRSMERSVSSISRDSEGVTASNGLLIIECRTEMGPPETTSWEYPAQDTSWSLEFDAFIKDIALDRPPDPGLHDAVAALRVVESVYAGRAVKTPASVESRS